MKIRSKYLILLQAEDHIRTVFETEEGFYFLQHKAYSKIERKISEEVFEKGQELIRQNYEVGEEFKPAVKVYAEDVSDIIEDIEYCIQQTKDEITAMKNKNEFTSAIIESEGFLRGLKHFVGELNEILNTK